MKKLLYGMAILATLSAPACSQRTWYEGLKQSHRNECNKAPPSAREECLKAVDGDSYDEYARKRQEEMKK
ncbi:MAG: hypothetical protein HY274_08950 [Gammaproteobacteria bacterium]|nr:hypothetical protein [Gammaproteobacteria bacterium]